MTPQEAATIPILGPEISSAFGPQAGRARPTCTTQRAYPSTLNDTHQQHVTIRREMSMGAYYEFSIEFVISGPTIDPDRITRATEILPDKSIKSDVPSEEMTGHRIHGSPYRKVPVWSCWLHHEPRLRSPDINPNQVILDFLERLHPHESYLQNLSLNGNAYLWLCIFSEPGNSAITLSSDVMKICGGMSIDVSVDSYSIPQRKVR